MISRLFFLFSVFTLVFSLEVGRAGTTNVFDWDAAHDKVSADINSLDLRQTLEKVAVSTGWRIYLDPGASRMVSAKFQNFSSGDALHSLLGNLNFLYLPQSNSAPHLYVFRTSRQQATGLIVAKKAVKPIPNELVVVMKPGSKTKIEDLARSLNAKIIGHLDKSNAYLLQFQDDASTQAARGQLAQNSDVAGIDVNYPIEIPTTLNASSGGLPDLQLKPNANNSHKVVIGLIDTPVQSLGASLDGFLLPAIHVAGDPQVASDSPSHGTAMAETIMDGLQSTTGGSTSVKILPVDVYGTGESTSTFNVANGIIQAINNGANIINMSLGGTGDSPMLHDIISQASKAGVIFYGAAGNDPVTTATYPAAYPEVISVTATDKNGNIASYANRGSFIDMTAPGDNIVAFNGQSFFVQGTSTSTAFASGTAAGLADAAGAPASQAETLLEQKSPKSTILKTVR